MYVHMCVRCYRHGSMFVYRSVFVHVCVCVCDMFVYEVCSYMCVCVCVCERERERLMSAEIYHKIMN